MALQDVLIEQFIKKLDVNKLLKEFMAKVNVVEVVDHLVVGLKDEIEDLQKDLDGDGKTEMQNILEDAIVISDKVKDIFARLEAARKK